MRRETVTGLIVGATFGLVLSTLVMLGIQPLVLRILVLPVVAPTGLFFAGHRLGLFIGLCFTPFIYALAGGLVGDAVGSMREERRRRRRKALGLCAECGYNLTGNVSGVCSECGERVDDGCDNDSSV